MRRLALITVALLPLAACGTTNNKKKSEELPFLPPNVIVAEEIESRISEIPFQHRQELFENLVYLSDQGEQAIPGLLNGLKHSDAKVRSSCAWVLGQIGDRRVIPYLTPLTEDENERTRLEAARTLVVMGDLKPSNLLVEALDSEHKEVRYYCHEALKAATGRDFGYDHLDDDLANRATAVLGWRQWYGDMAEDPFFATAYAEEHGLVPVTPETGKEETSEPAAPPPMFEGTPATPPAPPPGTGNGGN